MQVQLVCEVTKIPNIFDVGGNFHDVFNTHVLYSNLFATIMGLLGLEGGNNSFIPFVDRRLLGIGGLWVVLLVCLCAGVVCRWWGVWRDVGGEKYRSTLCCDWKINKWRWSMLTLYLCQTTAKAQCADDESCLQRESGTPGIFCSSSVRYCDKSGHKDYMAKCCPVTCDTCADPYFQVKTDFGAKDCEIVDNGKCVQTVGATYAGDAFCVIKVLKATTLDVTKFSVWDIMRGLQHVKII